MNRTTEHLLAALETLAPEGFSCINLVRDMERDSITTDQINANLAGVIYSGLKWGNWPWTM
jgi:hypothetical protein